MNRSISSIELAMMLPLERACCDPCRPPLNPRTIAIGMAIMNATATMMEIVSAMCGGRPSQAVRSQRSNQSKRSHVSNDFPIASFGDRIGFEALGQVMPTVGSFQISVRSCCGA